MLDDRPTSRSRLEAEAVAWMTTVSGTGVPSTAPVWFLLEPDQTITVFSRDPSIRVRNIRANPRVTLNLDGDGMGGAIVVVNADAEIARGHAIDHRAFIAKYQPFLDRYGWTAAWFSENYPTALRLRIRSVRGS